MDMCLSVLVGMEGKTTKWASRYWAHQVTGCHGLHSWPSEFEKLLREGPVFVPGSGPFE